LQFPVIGENEDYQFDFFIFELPLHVQRKIWVPKENQLRTSDSSVEESDEDIPFRTLLRFDERL